MLIFFSDSLSDIEILNIATRSDGLRLDADFTQDSHILITLIAHIVIGIVYPTNNKRNNYPDIKLSDYQLMYQVPNEFV